MGAPWGPREFVTGVTPSQALTGPDNSTNIIRDENHKIMSLSIDNELQEGHLDAASSSPPLSASLHNGQLNGIFFYSKFLNSIRFIIQGQKLKGPDFFSDRGKCAKRCVMEVLFAVRLLFGRSEVGYITQSIMEFLYR